MSPLVVVVLIVLVDLLGFTHRDAAAARVRRAVRVLAGADRPAVRGLPDVPARRRADPGPAERPLRAAAGPGGQPGGHGALVRDPGAVARFVMLLARMLDGASGGNILVAQAYVADVTKPEDRREGLGLIGAAFGVGFVLGPLLGGLMRELAGAPEWRLRLPFLVAAGFSTLAWVLVLLRLPESLPAGDPRRRRGC